MNIDEFKKEIKSMNKSMLLKVQKTYMWKQANLEENFYEYLVALNDKLKRK